MMLLSKDRLLDMAARGLMDDLGVEPESVEPIASSTATINPHIAIGPGFRLAT